MPKKKINGAGVAWLTLVGLILAAIPLAACAGDPAIEATPAKAPASGKGTPQDPCLGGANDCVDAAWYVTKVKVGDYQMVCVTQDTMGTGLQMACQWER